MFSGVVSGLDLVVTCLSVIGASSLAAGSDLRIIGGRDATDEELMYVIRLQLQILTTTVESVKVLGYTNICTCAALSCEWSLTARHCVGKYDFTTMSYKQRLPYNVTARLVVGYRSGDPLTSHVAYVLNATFPNAREIEIIKDDITLLRTEPLRMQTFGKLSALNLDTLFYQEVLAVGYGLTNHSHLYSELYDTKKLGKPLQISKAMLNRCGYSEAISFPDMCLSHKCGLWSTVCTGDSGGPVIHRSGIVAVNSRSFSHHNCQMKADFLRQHVAGIVTPVSPYLDWITSVIVNK